MNRTTTIRLISLVLLVAALIAINAFPFLAHSGTSYEIVFYSLAALHAEICLLTAWGIYAPVERRYGRLAWCFLGTALALLATIRLFAGQWTDSHPYQSLLLGVGALLPTLVPLASLFLTHRYFTGTQLVSHTAPQQNSTHFRLNQLLLIIAGFAFLSLLLRQILHAPDGWLTGPVDRSNLALLIAQSLVMGLLIGPCAWVVLKPSRSSWWWLVYFLAIVSVQPCLDRLVLELVDARRGIQFDQWVWPESYGSLVIDNLTWYGPQLLPTIGLFGLLRLAGVSGARC